jgi:ACS family glucarate transporter-like MFS transporter
MPFVPENQRKGPVPPMSRPDVTLAPAAAAAPPGAPTHTRYRVLAWLCSLSMITYIDRVCIMQVQGDMKRDLGLTTEQFAWAFSAFALAYAAFEVPTGWLGDRIGPRKVLTRIVLCWLLFTALTGCVPRWDAVVDLPVLGLVSGSLALLLLVRFLFGAGEAGAYPNMARATKNWFPFRERGRAQGLIWTFGRWGGALAPPLIIALSLPFTGLGYPGWRGAFLLLGVLGAFWVWGFARWFRDTPHEHPGVNDAERDLIRGAASPAAPAPISWAAILSSPTLWCLSFMYFCSNSGWSFFITYVNPYLKNDLRLEGWTLHLASGAPLFFGGIGCLLGGLLTDRQVRVWGRRWGRTLQGLVAYALGGGFFLLAVAMTGTNTPTAFAALCLASFVKDFAMAASWATTIDIGHRYSGTVAGLMNTVGNLGTVVSPPVVASLVALSGTGEDARWSVALYYYAAMFFVAAVCWLFINPRRVIVYAEVDRQRLQREGALD